MSIVQHTYVEPSKQDASKIFRAVNLSNEALRFQKSADFVAAESKYLAALELKIEATGPNSIQTCVTKNSLGELYIAMERLDEAQKYLEEAYEVRKQVPNFDTAVTREDLGQLWEMKGDLMKARQIRNDGGSNPTACGCPTCPGEMFEKSALKNCAKCHCVWYHDKQCQKKDWPRHKKYCKVMAL